MLYGNIFTKTYKAQILFWHLFYKAQILFWHLFYKAQILILALFYKAQVLIWHLFYKDKGQILIWHLFYKTQVLCWHYFTKPKSILATIYRGPKYYFGKNNYIMLKAENYFLAKYILKSLTHGKYKLLISQKYFFYKIYGNYAYFSIIN